MAGFLCAPTVTLSASHSWPTPSSAGLMCVTAGMDCACLLTVQWDHSVQLAPRFITSICFLWVDPSCGKITVEHLGKASAWFGSRSVPSHSNGGMIYCSSHNHIVWTPEHHVWTPFFSLFHSLFTVLYVSKVAHYTHVACSPWPLSPIIFNPICSRMHVILDASFPVGLKDARPWG